ncbi:MAG: MBL fold metallo-hydrolase [Acidobacteria bacterium]|nr:MBL fold metallo-hydrolase [Acidobacteriota bacterium]
MPLRRTFLVVILATLNAAVPVAQPAGTLQITLLGTGNPRPNLERFGPSILVEAGPRRVLIDAGRGAAQRLFEIGQRDLLTGIDALFLTHLHSDHTVGIPDVWLTSWIFGRAKALQMIGPPGTADMAAHLTQAYQWDIATRAKDEGFPAEGVRLAAADVAPGVVFDRDGLKVTAFAVDHGAFAVPAYGYRVDYQGRSAVFSGDMRFDERIVAAAKGADVMVLEVISPEVEARRAQVQDPKALERILARHISPDQAGTLFARVTPRLAVFTHVVPSPATAEDLVPATRKTYTGPLAVGYDRMTIVIGDTVDVFPRKTLSDQ